MDEIEKAVNNTYEKTAHMMQTEESFKKRLGIKEGVPGLDIKYVGESSGNAIIGMFLDSKIFKYYNSEGVELLNIQEIQKKKYWVKKSLYILGYEQSQDNDQTISKIDTKEKIHETNVVFYELFKQVDFLSNRLVFSTFIDAESSKYDKAFPLHSLEKFFNLKYLKFEDIEIIEKQGKISHIDANTLRIYTRKLLKNQCLDERFYLIQNPITKADLDVYLTKKYIDKKLYKQCLELIKVRDKRHSKMNKIQSETKQNIDSNFSK